MTSSLLVLILFVAAPAFVGGFFVGFLVGRVTRKPPPDRRLDGGAP